MQEVKLYLHICMYFLKYADLEVNMNENNIGTRLKRLRQNAHMSQSSLGKLVGKDGTTIGRYENNSLPIPSDVLLILSRHFEVSTDWILTGDTAYMQRQGELDEKLNNFSSLFQQLHNEDQLDIIELMEFKLYKRTGKLSNLNPTNKFDKMA